jgi:hypothetical protein
MTVGEAYDLAVQKKIIMMHRHEPNRVVMQIWMRDTPKPPYGRK